LIIVEEVMRTTLKALSFGCVMLGLASFAQAKEWRGIVPLHSTRADVVRLLGQCTNPERWCHFTSDEGEVDIVFPSRNEYADWCEKQLPPDVVMRIDVRPKTRSSLSDLGLDLKRFRKFDSGAGDEGYYDDEEGVIYDTIKGRVVHVVYIAEKKDRHICPSYYERPEGFVSKIADPPVLVVACPAEVKVGGRATFTVNISGWDPDVTPTFEWKVSSGKIVSGQSTWSIVVEAPVTNVQSIKATVELVKFVIPLSASCETQITGEKQGDKRAHP